MKKCQAKFVFNTMVANEAHCVTQMLESVYRYVDYWVIQDNGSTDGTQDIIRNFFAEKGIPGFLYEIPWSGCMGTNRDHTVQTCLKADHGCDWVVRVDADEILVVEDDFDWSVFDDLSIQSFNVTTILGINKFQRCWLWNARLPWKFKHDKRHECVYLDRDDVGEGFQRCNLSEKFRHHLVATGRTSMNPFKYYLDALELERDLLKKNELHTDEYHMYYLGKSYHDNVPQPQLPWGDIHNKELARRGLFFFERYLDKKHDYSTTGRPRYNDEAGYTALIWMSKLYEILEDREAVKSCLKQADAFCPRRSEHLKRLAWIYKAEGDYRLMLERTTKMVHPERTNPYPHYVMFIEGDSYVDSGNGSVQALHEEALRLNGQAE